MLWGCSWFPEIPQCFLCRHTLPGSASISLSGRRWQTEAPCLQAARALGSMPLTPCLLRVCREQFFSPAYCHQHFTRPQSLLSSRDHQGRTSRRSAPQGAISGPTQAQARRRRGPPPRTAQIAPHPVPRYPCSPLSFPASAGLSLRAAAPLPRARSPGANGAARGGGVGTAAVRPPLPRAARRVRAAPLRLRRRQRAHRHGNRGRAPSGALTSRGS